MGGTHVDPREALLVAIKAAFDGDPQAFINQTDNLNRDDVLMIGTVVQIYCYADFNGRRLVDVLRHAALGESRSASRLQDAQVFPALEKLVRDHLGDGDLKDGLLNASAMVELHRVHRHNFAHWMARRAKGADAIVMFSMNSKEAERRDGAALDPHEAKYGILPLEGFAAEVEKLKGHANYLARTAAKLEREVDALRDDIAARRSA
jgi:hypothetical protein